jgi:hypothetical protein
VARLVREPISTPLGAEKSPQAYLIFRTDDGGEPHV